MQDGLAVIVIGSIMAVTMHRPGQILCETVRMTVCFDHLRVRLERRQDSGHMRCCRRKAPDQQAQACKDGERLPCPFRDPVHCDHSAHALSFILPRGDLRHPPGEVRKTV